MEDPEGTFHQHDPSVRIYHQPEREDVSANEVGDDVRPIPEVVRLPIDGARRSIRFVIVPAPTDKRQGGPKEREAPDENYIDLVSEVETI